MTQRWCKAVLVPTALLAVPAGPARAAGFYLQEQSVRGAGRAFSGEVADVGAGSLWWNPAASGGGGDEAYLGLAAILPHGTAVDGGTRIVRPGQAPAAVGGSARSRGPIRDGYLPSAAIAHRLAGGLSAGLAVTSPYSFTTDYDAASWARYTADRTRLRTVDVQPSLAIAIPRARLGVALNVEHVSADLRNYLPNLSPLLPDGHQALRGKGWNVGYTVGGQLVAGPVTFGASYKSGIRHRLDGSVATDGLLGPLAGSNGTIATRASFRTPWQADLGLRWALSPALTLDAQVNRFGWSRFDAIRLGAPLNAAIPENYRNTWSYGAGLDWAATAAWTLRTGVQHDQTPTRDGFRDARVPDGNRWNIAGGTSYRLARVTLDAAVNYLPVDDVAIDRTTAAFAGTPAQTPLLVNGRLKHAGVVVFSAGARLAL